MCATLAWRETYTARLQLERMGEIKNKEYQDELGSKLQGASGGLNPEGSWTRGILKRTTPLSTSVSKLLKLYPHCIEDAEGQEDSTLL